MSDYIQYKFYVFYMAYNVCYSDVHFLCVGLGVSVTENVLFRSGTAFSHLLFFFQHLC